MYELKIYKTISRLKSIKRCFTYKIMLLILCVGVTFFEETQAQDFWQQTNGPFGGLIPAIAVTRDNVILAGSDGGGIFRSLDDGDSWIFSGLANSSIQSIAVDTNNLIYAGFSDGVFRFDNGLNWTPVNNGLINTDVQCLVVSTNNHIFAGTWGGGIFRSEDQGANWVQINSNLTNTIILSLVINMNGHIFAGTEGGGVFRSEDNGDNWVDINSGLTNLQILSLTVKHQNGFIFAGTYDGVFRSIDNGNNWTQVNNGITSSDILALIVNQAGDIIAGTYDGVYRSNDDGDNWNEINTGLTSYQVKSFAIKDGSSIFAGTFDGVFRSTDYGENWSKINNNLKASIISSLTTNKYGEIFTGTEGGGVFRSFDMGLSWEQVNNGIINPYIQSLAINSNDHIFAGTYDGVFRSLNNGNTWTQINNNLTASDVYTLAINPNDQIFAGTYDGVFRSTDNGNSWVQINTGLTRSNVNSLLINEDNLIFAGCDSGGFFRSTDNGNNWNLVNNGLTNSDILDITVNSSNVLFAGSYEGVYRSGNNGNNWIQVNSGLSSTDVFSLVTDFKDRIYAGTYEGVFASANNGDSWINVISGLTNSDIFSLTLHSSGFLFAGSYGSGVFKSTERTSLTVPILTSPQDGITEVNINPVFSWDQVSGATTYEFQLASDNNFSNIVNQNGGLTDTTIQVSGLAPDSTYFWRVNAMDGINTSYWSDVWSFTTFSYPQTIDLTSPSVPFPTHDNISNYVSEDYRIIGVPGRIDTDMNLNEILGDGGQGTNWQAYRDNGINSVNPEDYLMEFVNGNTEFIFGNGRAFWVINKGTLDINKLGVETANLNSDGEAEIQLHAGWNLITNPFPHPILWSRVQQPISSGTIVIDRPIYSFDGGWQNSDDHFTNFEPYIGYYVDSPSDMVLTIPYSTTFSKPMPLKKHVWHLDIELSMNAVTKSSTKLGVSQISVSERDRLDYRKPRSVGSIPSVYFYRPEWDEGYGIFATDFRPEIEEIEKWDFSVSGPLHKKTKLTFSEIDEVPGQHEIYLLDESRSVFLNLREKSQYSFIPVTEVSNFTILVGRREAVLKELEKVIPTDFELGKNFPNPFNPVTNIPVELPKAAKIKLVIYDILGKEIVTLFNGHKDIGRHYLTWTGRNYANQKVSAGVYLYKLEVNTSETFVGKMVMIK